MILPARRGFYRVRPDVRCFLQCRGPRSRCGHPWAVAAWSLLVATWTAVWTTTRAARRGLRNAAYCVWRRSCLIDGDLLDDVDDAAAQLGVGDAHEGLGEGEAVRGRQKIRHIGRGGRLVEAQRAVARRVWSPLKKEGHWY